MYHPTEMQIYSYELKSGVDIRVHSLLYSFLHLMIRNVMYPHSSLTEVHHIRHPLCFSAYSSPSIRQLLIFWGGIVFNFIEIVSHITVQAFVKLTRWSSLASNLCKFLPQLPRTLRLWTCAMVPGQLLSLWCCLF